MELKATSYRATSKECSGRTSLQLRLIVYAVLNSSGRLFTGRAVVFATADCDGMFAIIAVVVQNTHSCHACLGMAEVSKV